MFLCAQVIQCGEVSTACDVWSYGVVLWELLTHETPFAGIEGFQVAWLVVEKGERLTIPSSCPHAFADLMRACWQLDSTLRPTFHELLASIEKLGDDDELAESTDHFLTQKQQWQCVASQTCL